MLDQLDRAEFVLVTCTETYYRPFRGHEMPGKGKGADWEGALITQELYDSSSMTAKFGPVLFDSSADCFIPEPLRIHTRYALASGQRFELLRRFLLGLSGVVRAPLGIPATEPLPPDEPLRLGPDASSKPGAVNRGKVLSVIEMLQSRDVPLAASISRALGIAVEAGNVELRGLCGRELALLPKRLASLGCVRDHRLV